MTDKKGINWFYEINDPSDKTQGRYIQEYPEDMPEEDWEGWDDYVKSKKRKDKIWRIIAVVMTPFLIFGLVLVSFTVWEMMVGLYNTLRWWLNI